MSEDDEEIARLLNFWLASSDPDHMLETRKEWWVKDPVFDQNIRDQFADLFDQAARGDLDHWKETPLGCLALIILLDQFPRNMFRATKMAFAFDERARALTRHALKQGFDQAFGVGGKLFIYLPLEHSEDLQDQKDCLRLMRQLNFADYADFSHRHLVIIERFGRFPHRNAILERESTPEEIAFLKQPGSGF